MMRSRTRDAPVWTARGVCALGILFLAPGARGQEPVPLPPVPAAPPPPAAAAPMTLEDAERRAVDSSPALRVAEARIRAEEGRLRQAGLYPNPDVSLDSSRFTKGSGVKENILSLRQPILYPGKRRLEKGEAAQRIEVARRERDRERLDLLLAVRQQYYRIHFTHQILKVEEEDLDATRALRQAVDARVAAGDAPPFESLKALVEVNRAESDVSLLRGEIAAETASFNLLVDLPPDAPTAVAEPALDLEPAQPLAELEARAFENQPEILSRVHAAQAAGLAADRARLEPRPDVAVGPVVGAEEGVAFFGAGVSLRIPAWNRNQGGIAAAEAGREEALAQVDLARLALRRLVAESYGRYRAAHAQQLLFEQGLLAQATQLLDTSRKSYEGGESGILELLDARRTALAVREQYLRASLDAALAGLELRRAIGADTEGSK